LFDSTYLSSDLTYNSANHLAAGISHPVLTLRMFGVVVTHPIMIPRRSSNGNLT